MKFSLFFLATLKCDKFRIRLCKIEDVYVEGPSDTSRTWSAYIKSVVSFSPPKITSNKRAMASETVLGYYYTYIPAKNELRLVAENIDNDQMIEVIPYDYQECYQLSHNDKCYSYSVESKKFTLEKCRENDAEQIFAFECTDCADSATYDVYQKYKNEQKELEVIASESARIDMVAYKKLHEILVTMQTISKCFTINGMCNENATEILPISSFSHYRQAHHIDPDKIDFETQKHKNELTSSKKANQFYDFLKKDYFDSLFTKKLIQDLTGVQLGGNYPESLRLGKTVLGKPLFETKKDQILQAASNFGIPIASSTSSALTSNASSVLQSGSSLNAQSKSDGSSNILSDSNSRAISSSGSSLSESIKSGSSSNMQLSSSMTSSLSKALESGSSISSGFQSGNSSLEEINSAASAVKSMRSVGDMKQSSIESSKESKLHGSLSEEKSLGIGNTSGAQLGGSYKVGNLSSIGVLDDPSLSPSIVKTIQTGSSSIGSSASSSSLSEAIKIGSSLSNSSSLGSSQSEKISIGSSGSSSSSLAGSSSSMTGGSMIGTLI